MPDSLDFRRMAADSTDDLEQLAGLLARAPDYSLVVEGRLPTRDDARECLTDLPLGKGPQDKFFGGLWLDDALVGCLDLVRGYPDAEIAYVGLLLFAESHQGRGLGPRALDLAAAMAGTWACRRLRLAVIETNWRALRFWQRQGFLEIQRKPMPRYTGAAIVLERPL